MKNNSPCGKTTHQRSYYENLSYRKLQKVAMKENISANQKTIANNCKDGNHQFPLSSNKLSAQPMRTVKCAKESKTPFCEAEHQGWTSPAPKSPSSVTRNFFEMPVTASTSSVMTALKKAVIGVIGVNVNVTVTASTSSVMTALKKAVIGVIGINVNVMTSSPAEHLRSMIAFLPRQSTSVHHSSHLVSHSYKSPIRRKTKHIPTVTYPFCGAFMIFVSKSKVPLDKIILFKFSAST
ncbi:hypothetical protein GPALN_014942 [Globodera pallida]|nr:hypothetical protein GPALN_014942 [Globodera pallida]